MSNMYLWHENGAFMLSNNMGLIGDRHVIISSRDQRYTCVALIMWRDNHVSVARIITRTQIAAKRWCESQLNLNAILQLQRGINKESLHGVNVPM